MTDLNKMWAALKKYQLYADADGHGESWAVMCKERTEEVAAVAAMYAAAAYSAAAAAGAAGAVAVAGSGANAEGWSDRAIDRIEQAIKERKPVPSNIEQAIKEGAHMIDLNKAERQPLSIDQISMIFNRVYPAQPLSQNIINLVQEVEKHHGIR